MRRLWGRLDGMFAGFPVDPLRVAGALERAAGLRQEDVVQAGRVELEVGDLDPLAVEPPDDVGELLGPVGKSHRGGAVADRKWIAESREHGLEPFLLCV